MRRSWAAAALALGAVSGLVGCEEERAVVLLQVPDDPTITFKVWFAVGSQNDPPGKEGLAFLTGRLIAEGSTVANSYERILELLYPLAASYNVRVDREMTVLTGRVHRDHLGVFQDLVTDALLRPAFTPQDFERVRTDALNHLEKSLRYSSDEELGKAALYDFIFSGTAYAHPSPGTVQSVRKLTVEDVRQFYGRHYTADRALPALGGGFDADLARRFSRTLEGLPASAAPRATPPVPAPFEGRQLLLVHKPGADASISFGAPIDVRRGEREFYALWVANSWLGEHRSSSSHLFQVIREVRGLNYGDYSYIEAFPEGGRRSFPPVHVGRERQIFEVWLRTLPNTQAPFALRAALRELEHLVEHGLTADEFELTRSFLKNYVLHFAETTTDRLGYAVDDRFYGIEGEGHLKRFRRILDELTREEVNAAVRAHLHPERLKIAIVTGDPEGLRRALLGTEPTPVTYPTPKPPEVVAEDDQIARFPLGIQATTVRVVPVERMFEVGRAGS